MKINKKANEKKVFIVIPGFNEQGRIGKVIEATKKQGYTNIVFVDDGSRDRSYEEAQKAGAVTLKQIVNLGKGAATKTGIEYAISKGAKIIILMDADGQHQPEDLPRFLKEMEKSGAEIIFGSRTMDKTMPGVMKFGNWFITTATGILYGIKLKDTQSGYRCFTAEAYKKIKWQSNDYTMESEMIANVSKQKIKYSEIQIKTIYHDNFKGTTIFDGIKIFINILKFRILGGAL